MHPNARKHLKAPCPTTPGEIITDGTNHAINTGRRTATLVVSNTADRPIRGGPTTILPRPMPPLGLTARLPTACG